MRQPAFYYCQTLLGGDDINRRTIYALDTDLPIKTFNADMKRWTPAMQAELEQELQRLNDMAGEPVHGRRH